MKILAYIILTLLVAGCQQGSSASSPEPESNSQVKDMVIAHERKESPDAQLSNADSKDREELFYQNMIGEDFSMLNFTTTDDEELILSSLRGKVVFLNFWYKNCPPCIAEMEGLKYLHDKYKNEDCVFIMITFEDLEVIQEIRKEYGLSYKMVSVARDTISSWGIRGYPSSFVLDKEGVIAYARAGGQDVVQKATVEVLAKFSPKIETQLASLK